MTYNVFGGTLNPTLFQLGKSSIPRLDKVRKAAFTPGQHVSRQHVACMPATKLLPVCCPSVAGYKRTHVAEIQATCCRQQTTCCREKCCLLPQHVARPRNMSAPATRSPSMWFCELLHFVTTWSWPVAFSVFTIVCYGAWYRDRLSLVWRF